jgi:hypothetical protein
MKYELQANLLSIGYSVWNWLQWLFGSHQPQYRLYSRKQSELWLQKCWESELEEHE